MSEGDCVRVALRIRPLVNSELNKGCQEIVEKIKQEPQILVKNHETFTFNYVFGSDEPQEAIYEESVKQMVTKLFEGYNVTILAYGQTGSGKTHTMGTAFNGIHNSEMGVIPRSMYDIFKQISDMDDHQFTVTCSFLELYQEQLYDLLSVGPRDQAVVDIREDVNKGIVIPNLTETLVTNAEQTTTCLIKGSAGRAVGATAMNEQSSRSHAIFTITIQMMKNHDTSTSTTAKFNLVDLAGSERSKKTKATGDRFKEGVKINQGLLALGNVISALGCGQPNVYIGYRDSKLTRLLQDSLGGNSVTLMIACISPADYNMNETISTLRYADRARKIKNKPVVNQDPKTAEINRLNNVIQKLRLDLLNNRGNSSLGNCDSQNVTSDTLGLSQEINLMRKQVTNLNEKNRNLQQQLQATLHDVAEIEMRAVIAEEAHEKLQKKFDEIKKLANYLHSDNIVDNGHPNSTEHAEKVNEIYKIVGEIDTIFKDNREELISQKSSSANTSINDLPLHEDVQQKYEQFTTKQVEINNELRKINRELALKESHHQQVAINLTRFCSYEGDHSESIIKESESKIQLLEAEKKELTEMLKSVKENVSAKIAEDRRKRLQSLEQEINALKKKNLQQSKLLQVREKDMQKITNLNNEIQQMKAAKINLIRSMRKESESFRHWKLNREKQLTQLKEKDRKRQNEMARMEALHNKQKNVLKRKVEEAMAVNKRLKDVLDKQKSVHLKRNATNNQSSGKMEQLLSTIDHELELILSVIDAQNSLDQLMEDRAAVHNRLKELKTDGQSNADEINNIEHDLLLRNAQIDDLQQKVVSSNIENKIKAIYDGISNLPEAKGALKHIFNALIELRREFASKDYKIEEFKAQCESAEEKITILEKQIEENERKFNVQILNTETNYEEKITVLLRELSKTPQQVVGTNEVTPEMNECLTIQQEAFDKIDTLREKLEEYKQKCAEYQQIIDEDKFKKPRSMPTYCIDESGDEYDPKDPDWHMSPMFKQIKRNRTTLSQSTLMNATKRTSDGLVKCRCKTSCSTKRCSCRHNASGCSDNCGCSGEICMNRIENTIKVKEEDDEKENDTNIKNTLNGTFDLFPISAENSPMHTPPKKQKSSLPADEQNKMDVTTPIYPFKLKKRTPFYD